ncbi:MAG TPA: HAMP domain-containing sensor histidine kinase [Gemmatimonadaceae bacterium]|nr:HAMP domain-containing sensor histidine kinase [Gemmatimonadaceae bacterium]
MVDRRRPERRALFLAEISRTLIETLDAEQTLVNTARQAMPELNAWAIVDVVDEAGQMRRLAVMHPDPALQPLADELHSRYPAAGDDILGVARILETQQPELVAEVTREVFGAARRDKRYMALLRSLRFCSYMVLPLKARGRLLGAITFIGAEEDQRYSPKDLLFAEDLAGRTAMAMDNARLYQEAEEARREAVAAVARAAIADRAKNDFLSTMSHELRTPLNAIAGYAELLELGMRGPVSEQQHEAIRRIRRSQQHLLGIVNDILTFAKTDAGRMPIHLEPTNVGAAMQGVQFLVEPMLATNRIQFSYESCDSGLGVMADRDRLQQILVNLLSNAAKFSPPGGPVVVRCEVRDHLVAILVEDKGQGISADKLEVIFEPFVQLSSGLTRTVDGSGLGLSISRELARMMGGDVSVKSEPGKGSTFTLTLPMSPPAIPVL